MQADAVLKKQKHEDGSATTTTTTTAPRGPPSPTSSSNSPPPPAPLAQVPIRREIAARSTQKLVKTEVKDKDVVLSEVSNSPYGQVRPTMGWGDVFSRNPAKVTNIANVHLGLSSLNATPNPGASSTRDMKALVALYSLKFSALEHCATYHRAHDAAIWKSWLAMCKASGKKFKMTVKMPKFVTHDNLLTVTDEVQAQMQDFFSKARLLEDHLGPILVQLPEKFKKSDESMERLEAFCEHLPKGMQFAFEFRNAAMYCEEVYSVLKKGNHATVVYHLFDGKQDFTAPYADTSDDFVYIRLHGAMERFVGDYGPEEMSLWAAFIKDAAKSGKTVYAFFNNNESHVAKGSEKLTSSVVDCTQLAKLLNAKRAPAKVTKVKTSIL